MTKVTFRPAEQDDISIVFGIVKSAIAVHKEFNFESRALSLRQYGPDKLHSLQQETPSGLIVALVDGRVEGFAVLVDDCKTLYIPWITVDPKSRSFRIGPLLFQEVLRIAQERHYPKVWWVSLTTSTGIIRHSQRVGAHLVGEMKKHWHGQDYLYWNKIFDEPVAERAAIPIKDAITLTPSISLKEDK